MKRQRLAERRKAIGLSQEQLAVLIGVDTTTIGRWERAEASPQPAHRPKLAKALQVSVNELAVLLIATHTGRTIPRTTGVPATPHDIDMPGSATTATNSHDASAGRFSVLSARLSSALLYPTPSATTQPVTAKSLTNAAMEAWDLRQRTQYEALGHLLAELIPQAEAYAADANTYDATTANEALVHLYNAASSLLKRLGNNLLAAVAADRAVRTALLSDSPALIACAKYRLANVLLAAGRLDEALTTAFNGADHVDVGRVNVPHRQGIRGGLLLTAAVAAARKSDRATAYELLGEAHIASQLLGKDVANLYTIFGPTNVAIHHVQIAMELGDAREAIRRGQQVNPRNLPNGLAERRGQFLIDMARAHILKREYQAATTALVHAERVAPQELELSDQAYGAISVLLSHPRANLATELRALAKRIDHKA
ncbi:helix-turn-helix domain-containing protein [Allorhizocola rhizosphaerae]|uniref:helix-turn-helix domain-containing protein n=1 Tax=Allorhizocola rhizosphaerae TaxID=1872709 RepID=UPI000E3D0117|nr:helix-turn-helix transcriptional regulator [Allorhizocola rhizosphaerae]